jgi:phage head maturation protease
MTITTVRKDALASIGPGEDDDTAPNGSFHIVLSDATKDRDGESLQPGEWEMPLPEHITMDRDHEMSVAGTVGSGVPTLEPDGALHVRGTYSSLPMAQDVRTLVNEGHIKTTSVTFLRKSASDAKGGKTVRRELLNGAFVAIPSNPNARVLSSKASAAAKEGRRNSGNDADMIQAIHNHAAGLGAACNAGGKSIRKDADTETADDPGPLAQAVDAAIDEAIDLLSQVDATTLPEPVQQAIALITSADATVDELLAALGVADPDETDDQTAGAADAAKAAPAAPAADAAALADRMQATRARALAALAAAYKTGG